MYIKWLNTQKVRNLDNVAITPVNKLNIFTGKNASGKTAVLESIFLLARAKSFRTPKIQEVIQHGEASLTVTAKIQHEAEGEIHTGINKRYGEVTIKKNGQKIKTISEQAKTLPIILITQETQGIISGSPKTRRHWLDWAMFHVEPDYLELWKTNMRALRHRNALLKKKEKNRENYRAWEEAMVESANLLSQQRKDFLEGILGFTRNTHEQNIISEVDINLSKGWPEAKDYTTVLEESWKSDMEKGYTRCGIHQADINFSKKDKRIASTYSRGQIKQFAVFLMLAQAKETRRRTGICPVIIMDDFKAELDDEGSKHILMWIKKESFQAFLSTTDLKSGETGDQEYQQFHVKHGKITELSKV